MRVLEQPTGVPFTLKAIEEVKKNQPAPPPKSLAPPHLFFFCTGPLVIPASCLVCVSWRIIKWKLPATPRDRRPLPQVGTLVGVFCGGREEGSLIGTKTPPPQAQLSVAGGHCCISGWSALPHGQMGSGRIVVEVVAALLLLLLLLF